LPDYKNSTYKNISIFKSCKSVSSDHPLRFWTGIETSLFRLEFTDEYLRQIGYETFFSTFDPDFSPDSGIPLFSEEWLPQNLDTEVFNGDGWYVCSMNLGHIYRPTNRIFLPYWEWDGAALKYIKKYLPKDCWIDQWFMWWDTYLEDGDQTGFYYQPNAFKLDQSYGGKGCWDHMILSSDYQYMGIYQFYRIYSHTNPGNHSSYEAAYPVYHRDWPAWFIIPPSSGIDTLRYDIHD